MIGDARVVTVCEASHGIRDIFQLKHRLFEYLVTQKGFTTFVITASYADSFSLWRFVRGEDLDPSMALAEMRWWTVDNEEVLELVHWMRAYNDNSSTSRRKLSFYGSDVNAPASNVHRVVEYLQKVDAPLAENFTDRLEPIGTDFAAARFPFADESSKTKVSKSVEDLVGIFSSESEGWIRATDVDFERARLAAHGLSQRLESLLDPSSAWQVKDKSCAENIGRILEMEGRNSKVMVWTHNGHGQRAPFMSGVRPMGDILDEMFGDDHVIIGTAFGEGSLRAIDPQTGVLRDFNFLLPSEETLDGALATVEHPIYAVDCRAMPQAGEASEWLSSRPGSRFTGSDYSEDARVLKEIYEMAYDLTSDFAPTDPRDCFDVLVFLRSVTAAKSNWPVSPAGPIAPIHAAPENFDLSERDEKGFPVGWTVQAARVPGRHELDFGDGAVTISRSGIPWRWGEAGISQRFKGRDYAGRSVRLSAKTTIRTDGIGCASLLSIQAATEKGPLTTSYSNAVEGENFVELQVPIDATTIEIALIHAGEGRSTFSEIRLATEG